MYTPSHAASKPRGSTPLSCLPPPTEQSEHTLRAGVTLLYRKRFQLFGEPYESLGASSSTKRPAAFTSSSSSTAPPEGLAPSLWLSQRLSNPFSTSSGSPEPTLSSQEAEEELLLKFETFPNGAPRIHCRALLTFLLNPLKKSIQLRTLNSNDAASLQLDVKNLSTWQLLALRVRNSEFKYSGTQYEAHRTFLRLVDLALFRKVGEQLIEHLLGVDNEEFKQKNLDYTSILELGHAVVIILGYVEGTTYQRRIPESTSSRRDSQVPEGAVWWALPKPACFAGKNSSSGNSGRNSGSNSGRGEGDTGYWFLDAERMRLSIASPKNQQISMYRANAPAPVHMTSSPRVATRASLADRRWQEAQESNRRRSPSPAHSVASIAPPDCAQQIEHFIERFSSSLTVSNLDGALHRATTRAARVASTAWRTVEINLPEPETLAGYADLLNDVEDFPHPEDSQSATQGSQRSNESIPSSQLFENLLGIGSAFSYL